MGTWPDIAHTIGLLSQFSSNPSEFHVQCVRCVFGYLSYSSEGALTYLMHPNNRPNVICGYTDTDYAGEKSTAKSTSGYVYTLHDTAISWTSKRQESVAKSTMEAEYITLAHTGCHAAWIIGFMEEVGYPLSGPLPLFCDNEAAITNATGEEVSFKRSKHIIVKYHKIHKHISNNEISITHVPSEENIADIFTKAIPKEQFKYLVRQLGFEPFENLE